MLELEEFLPYRLSVLSNRVSQGVARTYRERFGISVTEWRVIAILGRYPGLSATEVAARSAMDKVAVSRAVRGLLTRGLVSREDNHADRRAKHLHLSREGQRLYDAIVPAALAYEKSLLAVLDADEQARLQQLLDKLQAAAERF